jgi:hypothetical protein
LGDGPASRGRRDARQELTMLKILALAALVLGAAAPANASLVTNSLTGNSLTTNALNSNALTATGAALDDLDGVRVEAVALPDAAR